MKKLRKINFYGLIAIIIALAFSAMSFTACDDLSAPDTPTNVTATATSSSSITVSWSSVSGATSYNIYGGVNSFDYSLLGTSTTFSYSHTGLSANTTYYYKVSALNSIGESAQSDKVSAKTLKDDSSGGTDLPDVPNTPNTPNTTLSVPTNVKATASSSNRIFVSWSSVSLASGYYIYRSLSSSGDFIKVGTTDSITTYFSDTGLSAGTDYYYKVASYNKNGESAQSDYVLATTLPIIVPDTPTNVTATPNSSSRITISWSSMSDATGYKIYRSLNSSDDFTQVGTSASTSYVDTGLSADTYYYYKVAAYNENGTSSQSNYVSAKTTLIPDTPTGVTATGNNISITVSWSSVFGADGYKIYRSTNSSGTFGYIGTTTETSYSDEGLSVNTSYYYKVTAYNSYEESAQSNYILATILGSEANPIPLSLGTWDNNLILSGGEIWYSLSVLATENEVSYFIWWNDSNAGNKDGDILVSFYKANGSIILVDGKEQVDSAWTNPIELVVSSSGLITSGTIKLKVTPKTSSTAGTFAITYGLSGIFRPN